MARCFIGTSPKERDRQAFGTLDVQLDEVHPTTLDLSAK
jgi:hypothetical protein